MTYPKKNQDTAPAAVPTPLDTLRAVTSEYHRKLEAAIDWMASFQSYAAYLNLLERFAVVVPPLEQAIAEQLATSPPPEFEPGVRTRWLESDLSAIKRLTREGELGDRPIPAASSDELASLTPRTVPACDFSYINNAESAIGAQYVLVGSSLGGQVLARQLHERLQLTAEQGSAYFVGYGPATVKRWQAFRQWANQQLDTPHATRLAAEAAELTFARFGSALAGLAYD